MTQLYSAFDPVFFVFLFSLLNGTFGVCVVSLLELDQFQQWQTAKEANTFGKKTQKV